MGASPRVARQTLPTAVGLFAGVGGLERGLHSAGFETELLCEVDGGQLAETLSGGLSGLA